MVSSQILEDGSTTMHYAFFYPVRRNHIEVIVGCQGQKQVDDTHLRPQLIAGTMSRQSMRWPAAQVKEMTEKNTIDKCFNILSMYCLFASVTPSRN